MLVLTRKNEQAVVIGSSDRFEHVVKVTILEINGRCVKLGIEAHKDVVVHRDEVLERIRTESQRDPPASAAAQAVSHRTVGRANVLSGAGKGRPPRSLRERI